MKIDMGKVISFMKKKFYIADNRTGPEKESRRQRYELLSGIREVESCADILKGREAYQWPPFDGRMYDGYGYEWYKPLNENGLKVLMKAYQKPDSFSDDMVGKWICIEKMNGDDVSVCLLDDSVSYAGSLLKKLGEDKTQITASTQMPDNVVLKDKDAEMKKLDKINEALQILDGVRDNMLLLESGYIKHIPAGICIVFETAVDRVQGLLSDVALVVEKDILQSEGETLSSDDVEPL